MKASDDEVPDLGSLPSKDKILIAARDEFVERGFEGARMQRIAEISGANKAMIYYYFGGKRELYLRVAGAVFNQAIETLAGIVATDQPPELKLSSVVRFYVDFYSRNQDFLRLMMREFANRGPILNSLLAEMGRTAREKGFPAGLDSIIKLGMGSKAFRDQDSRQTIMSLVSMCAGYFILQPVADLFLGIEDETGRREFVADRADAIAELLLRGIAAQKQST